VDVKLREREVKQRFRRKWSLGPKASDITKALRS
jgi:hypothetical protein